MHQPRPYGLHVIGLPLTDKDKSFISSAAMRVTNLKGMSGVDNMKMVYDLPDGGYVIVQDMGGNFRVIAHKPIHGKDIIFDGIETDYIPMLFSGVITKAIVYENEPVGIKLTEQARFRLVNYQYLETKPDKDIELQRFRIDYNDLFQEFKPTNSSAYLRTQYNQQRPTWYSGAMAEVMQIVGGYGRQDFAQLPDEKVNKFERARMILPAEWLERINSELEGLRLPAYTGLPPADGSFQFDYKFNNTNAISFDASNKPWLLRISASGVYAMPLPIVPATRTNAFRRYMQLVGDDEILAIIDRFGGMPSGESFPVYKGFEAWRRAGVIIKVCDTSDFYSHIAYSSACGWSLNTNGSEGYNTCYDYYDDEGLGYGLTYNLTLNLVGSDDYYGAKRVELAEYGPIADKVRQYLGELIPNIGSDVNGRAILYKLRRATSVDIYQRALGRNGSDKKEAEYWDNLEMSPIAKHSGSVREVYRGYLYHGAKFSQQPQIKFPEPFVGGCISHDFLPAIEGRYNKKPNCDTIMFAYYVGNSLKTIKYFIDWREFNNDVVSNFEPHMTAGQWQQIESVGKTQLQGCFYSSDIDDREVVSPTVTTTDIIGVDRGYDSKPFFAFDAFFSMVGSMWRNRYFTHLTKTKTVVGRGLELAMCVPYLCRNAAIHARIDFNNGVRKTEGFALGSVQDPTTYNYWTYHKDLAWTNMSIGNPKGTPFPENGNPVWVEEMNYRPSPASDFADNGDWVGGLPADYTWLIHPDSNVWQHDGGGSAPSINAYYNTSQEPASSSGFIRFSIADQPYLVNKTLPDNGYYIGSPNIFGDYFYKDACQVLFGDIEYANVSESSSLSARAYWGYSKLVDHKSPHHFIGVINE